jgi:hypothetical protein
LPEYRAKKKDLAPQKHRIASGNLGKISSKKARERASTFLLFKYTNRDTYCFGNKYR